MKTYTFNYTLDGKPVKDTVQAHSIREAMSEIPPNATHLRMKRNDAS